ITFVILAATVGAVCRRVVVAFVYQVAHLPGPRRGAQRRITVQRSYVCAVRSPAIINVNAVWGAGAGEELGVLDIWLDQVRPGDLRTDTPCVWVGRRSHM